MSAASLELIQTVGLLAMVVLPVEIDSCCAERVSRELAATLSEGVSVVVADLSGTGFCDSSGVRALIAFHQRAVANGTELGRSAKAIMDRGELVNDEVMVGKRGDLREVGHHEHLSLGAERLEP